MREISNAAGEEGGGIRRKKGKFAILLCPSSSFSPLLNSLIDQKLQYL
jgi:hypothetical protein